MAPRRVELGGLARLLRGRLSTDPGTLQSHRGDGSHLRGDPLAVIAPADEDDVVTLVRWARRHRLPLVARGAGTSLDGESVPTPASAVVDFSAWTSVGPVDPLGGTVLVGPGVVNAELDRLLEPHALFFPPNPGSWRSCTIGGNVATNASGPRSFRYGPTRRWVRQLRAVAGTGELLQVGTRASKQSLGPSLLELLVGSEGTLALTTAVLLRLAPRPERRVGVVVGVPSGEAATRLAVSLVNRRVSGLSAIEYVDGRVAEELSRREGSRVRGDGPLVLLEVEGSEAETGPRLEALHQHLTAVLPGAEASVYPDANRLWTVRGESGVVLDQSMGERIREDICVPLASLGRLFDLLSELGHRFDAPIATFGHLGDGNLHPNIGLDPGSAAAERFRAALYDGVLRLGGTISGEHGVGIVKTPFVDVELGRPAVRLLREVKAAFDPEGILNPGKVYPAA